MDTPQFDSHKHWHFEHTHTAQATRISYWNGEYFVCNAIHRHCTTNNFILSFIHSFCHVGTLFSYLFLFHFAVVVAVAGVRCYCSWCRCCRNLNGETVERMVGVAQFQVFHSRRKEVTMLTNMVLWRGTRNNNNSNSEYRGKVERQRLKENDENLHNFSKLLNFKVKEQQQQPEKITK